MNPAKSFCKMEASSKGAQLSTTTSSKALKVLGRTLTSRHLESLFHNRLRRLVLKDVKIRGPKDEIKLPPHLVELTVDNCPDLMHHTPRCLAELPDLRTFTLGTDVISATAVRALNELDVDHHFIIYGHRFVDALDNLDGLRRLRSLRIHATGLVGMASASDLDIPSFEEDFDEIETEVYQSLRQDSKEETISAVGNLIENSHEAKHAAAPMDRPLSVEGLEMHALFISDRFPFHKFKNVKSIKLWARKEMDREVLNEISVHMERLEVLHFGGSVALDADALQCLQRLKRLREIFISNAVLLPGSEQILRSLPNRPKYQLHCCKTIDQFEGDRRFFSDLI